MKSIFSLSFDINTRKKIPTNKNLKYGITVFSECSILTAFIKDITWGNQMHKKITKKIFNVLSFIRVFGFDNVM